MKVIPSRSITGSTLLFVMPRPLKGMGFPWTSARRAPASWHSNRHGPCHRRLEPIPRRNTREDSCFLAGVHSAYRLGFIAALPGQGSPATYPALRSTVQRRTAVGGKPCHRRRGCSEPSTESSPRCMRNGAAGLDEETAGPLRHGGSFGHAVLDVRYGHLFNAGRRCTWENPTRPPYRRRPTAARLAWCCSTARL